jgi:chloramphenicol 3-O phosphotransferase
MDTPYLYFSSDQLVDAGVLPDLRTVRGGEAWDWKNIRPRFFDGFHRCIGALAEAGNDLIVEHVIERRSWFEDCAQRLSKFDAFFVGVHCPLEELERRERLRGDRSIGEGRSHLEDGVHSWGPYDFEIDTSLSDPERNAALVKAAFDKRPESCVLKAFAG